MRLDHFVTHIHREFDKDMLHLGPWLHHRSSARPRLGTRNHRRQKFTASTSALRPWLSFQGAWPSLESRRSPSCGGSCLDARCGWQAAVPDPRGQWRFCANKWPIGWYRRAPVVGFLIWRIQAGRRRQTL